ncbi:MaoC/PaaZ C-terminal domain-containing protein [Haloechinothrix sp. LS1_15]|uniref:MaoC/PaaZ C-terminal domain-containing protein n=1 Tax=Haloechinothrix sp. LS1_15 TaxID=2652248 RepID=UPI00294B4C8C|nr:MaoC/PaaZ C-terminal domain-containing protein [Haloechinothrix sp. LS1_15]
MSEVATGDELPPLRARVTRADLVRYAGASLDFNPIHYSDRIATEVGLPGVIAHGMLTMGLAGRVVSEWIGDAGRVLSCTSRFTRPVVVPDDDHGAVIEFSGTVTAVDDGVATVSITAKCEGKPVLGKARATVRVD